MAGTTKGHTVTEIHQGPGDLWSIPTAGAPADATVRLTLASDGTPDATAHASSVHLGAVQSAITFAAKPKFASIDLDQYDAPFDQYPQSLAASIEAEMAQTEAAKLQRVLGVGTYGSGSGYKQVTFGGTLPVPESCIALISPTKESNLRHIVTLLYRGVATGGFSVSMGRAKSSSYKARFEGLMDLARTAGKQMGVAYKTTTDCSGGTPTAKDLTVGEIYQGPADLWLISAAPLDATARVTLDATTLTPDATAHANAKCLGMSEGPVTLTVTPKIVFTQTDQYDGPLACFIQGLEAKIECELNQTSMEKLSRLLEMSTYSTSTGYEQFVFGGGDPVAAICVAAIGKKRLATTLPVVFCLYRVHQTEGVSITASRQKASTYKVTFTGLMDGTRTAGKQVGIFHEGVAV